MLSKERHRQILNLLEEKKSITVTELSKLLDISESTARRDIIVLDNAGKLVKVFGGAVSADHIYSSAEPTVAQKSECFKEEKKQIAKYAASLIEPQDFVYLDAGTTTGYIIDFLGAVDAVFVTNAVAHAQRLAADGRNVILIGGTLKSSTEAVVGTSAVLMLKEYHFTKGFFGTNGVSQTAGFTTPDANEALVKKTAFEQCKKAYILCDHSKFHTVSSVTFAPVLGGIILSDEQPDGFLEGAEVLLCQ